MADVSKALNIVRKLNPMGFFSRATEEAQRLPQAKGTGEQMRAMLLKQGVKDKELKATGFNDWIKDKKSVTRDEIAEYLRRNEVQLGEKTLGADPAITEKVATRNSRLAAVSKETDDLAAAEIAAGRVPAQNPRWKELEKEYYSIIDAPFPEKLDPKFQQYTLPGGENYREVLMTMKDPQGVFRALNQKYDDPIAELTRKHQSLNDEVKRIYADPNSTGNDFARAQDYARDANGEMRALILKRDREVAAAQQMVRPYLSPHFDNEPDVLAHMRTKDRTDAEGRRVLHLEELQSDWAQEGRKKGFKQQPDPAKETPLLGAKQDAQFAWEKARSDFLKGHEDYQKTLQDQTMRMAERWGLTPEEIAVDHAKGLQEWANMSPRQKLTHAQSEFMRSENPTALPHYAQRDAEVAASQERDRTRNALFAYQKSIDAGLPTAPFVESTPGWTNLALKRAMIEAARGNYDAIAWTPGAQQAKRYDLSKQVKEIGYIPNPDGTYQFSAIAKDGRGLPVPNSQAMTLEQIESAVGKEMAEKIKNGEGAAGQVNGSRSLSGLDLQVGGEGMKAYYDKILPTQIGKVLKDINETPQFGTISLPVERQSSKQFIPSGPNLENAPQSYELPSINLTPQMREKINQGLPLFTMMPAAVGLGATASQMQEGQNPAVEGEGFADGGKIVRKALEAIRGLPPAENSRLTQIATTGPSYEKALRHLQEAGVEGRAIDYGAGRGHGMRGIGADTFEPYPQGWTPTFTKPEDIPDDVYRRLVNLNVLNVLGPEARDAALLNMGRVVEPGGGGVISTRGRDVMSARGEPGPEPMSLIIGEGDQARYQKGFTPRELREYVGDTLGPRFDVDPADVGQASVLFRRNRENGGPVDMRAGEMIGLRARLGLSPKKITDRAGPIHTDPAVAAARDAAAVEETPAIVKQALDVVRSQPRQPVARPLTIPAPRSAPPEQSESQRLWQLYNESENPADFVRADEAMRAGRADGGFNKGGVVGEGVKKAVQLSRKILGYTDPPSQKIDDWKWRSLPDVATELDVQKIPPHVQQFGDYMLEMADKAKRGEISDRDLIKAYTTTRASIQRRSQDTDKIREASGLPLAGAEDKIRPEGAWSEWLMSPAGQRYLDKAVKGEMPEDTVESALSLMRSFGLAPTQINAMDWAAKNLPGRGQAASDLVYRGSQKASPASEWRDFTSDVAGVGSAKSGFLASLLGRGDLPTLDARQVILNTGLPTDASQKAMARSYQGQKGFGAQEGVDRLAARQEALGLAAPSKYDPFYQHLTHHTIWDKASNEQTTHADIMNAMRNAAIVLGVPAAGAATMPEEQPVERADGGRLLEDQYPTQYLPNVGRQVMQDGGAPNNDAYLDALLAAHSDPNADIKDYKRSMGQIAQQPEDVRSMTHAPSKPMRPIEIEGGFIGKRQLGQAPYDVAGPLSTAANLAYSAKTLPFYFTPAMPLAAASDFGEAVIDTKNALDKGDYLSAAASGVLGVGMGAFPFRKQIGSAIGNAVSTARDVLGRVPAPYAAGAAGAAAMTPEEAQAGKLDAAGRVVKSIFKPAPRAMTLQDVRRVFDPQAGAGMKPEEVERLVDAYGKVASPASSDPELANWGQKIAQSYITKGGSGYGGRSYFAQKPSVPLEDLGRAAEPIPYTHQPKPIVEKSWEDVGRERAGSPVISLGGDLSDLVRLRGYGAAGDLRALARPSDIHAGFDYMREPNLHSVWSNNPEHAAQLEKAVLGQKDIQRAVEKDLPVMAVANPMGPRSIDSSKNMMDLYLSAVEGGGIPSESLKAATNIIRSGAFGDSPKAKEALRIKLANFPGFEDMDKARAFLLNNPDVVGTTRGAIIKGLERADLVKRGFPEVGQLRAAATSQKFMMAPGNMMGGRMVELDPRMFHQAEANRYFDHFTYGGDTPGQYYADVPLIHRQYGAPDATDMLLAKFNQYRPGATKKAPLKPPITAHPFSTDQTGRDTWRKMFEEQRMVQEINDRMMDSIRRGEAQRPLYGFKRGGSVSHIAMMIAKELGSSPSKSK